MILLQNALNQLLKMYEDPLKIFGHFLKKNGLNGTKKQQKTAQNIIVILLLLYMITYFYII
jgi:hypothetical protein